MRDTPRRGACTALLPDATDRQGFAGADLADDAELTRVLEHLRAAWSHHPLYLCRPATWNAPDVVPASWHGIVDGVFNSGCYTDVRRLSHARTQRHVHTVVVRPSVLLVPPDVLGRVVGNAQEREWDLAIVDGIPSDVLYVVSARLLTLVEGAGAIPGAVTIPQAVERLGSAGARLEGQVHMGRLSPDDVSWRDQAMAAALPRYVWKTPRLGSLLATPAPSRLAEALRRAQGAHDEAREALRHRASRHHVRSAATGREVLVTVPSRFQSGAQAAWAELLDYLPPTRVAFVVGRSTALKRLLDARGFTSYETSDGMVPTSAADAAVFLAALDETRPAIVHFDGTEGRTWAPTVFERGMRVVQHVRLNDVERFTPSFVYADAIIGVSPHVCAEITARVGRTCRVAEIADGVCLRTRPERQIATSPAPGGNGVALSCLCVGRVEPAKGQLRVLDVFDELRRVMPCRLEIIGACGRDAAYCDQVLDRVRAAGADAVTWRPFVHPMTDAYRQADVVLVGSRNEALGMVGLEALAAGALLVAHRSTGYASIVDPSRLEGLLFDSDEPAADIATRIIDALARCATYAANGRRKVETCFDARGTASRLMALWDDVSAGAAING